MHLAACEGHPAAIRFMLTQIQPQERQKMCNVTDRWGGTPLGEATANGHTECAMLLKKAGGQMGKTEHY